MIYSLLRFGHLIGLVLIGAGLIGLFVPDLRSRKLRDLRLFAEAIRYVAVFYEGLVVPGALLLPLSGTWMTWLAGMVVLFAFEFIEGNTVTRLYFMRMRRLTNDALEKGMVTPDLEHARRESIPTFTHFLDIPLLLVIVSLGALRPNTWLHFFAGTSLALVVAAILTVVLPRLYPWNPSVKGQETSL